MRLLHCCLERYSKKTSTDTNGGHATPKGNPALTLQRVEVILKDGKLLRLRWKS